MTKRDTALQNSNGSPILGAASQDGGAGSGIRRDPAEFQPCPTALSGQRLGALVGVGGRSHLSPFLMPFAPGIHYNMDYYYSLANT